MFAFLEDFKYARWVKRLNRTTQVILSLALVGGLNFVAARHYTRWDLTPTRRYSLSAETLADLDQIVRKSMQTSPGTPLTLYLISSSSHMQGQDMGQLVLDQVGTLLKEYEDAANKLPGGKIDLEIKNVDVDKQLDMAKKLQQYSPMTTFPEVLVQFGDRTRVLNQIDLYEVEKNQTSKELDPKKFRGENAITSAILDVVEKRTDKIYFTTGHGELSINSFADNGLSNLSDALKLRDYKLAEINLANVNDVPADAKVVVIVLPSTVRSAFAPEEQEKLRRYLDNQNGRVLLYLDPNADPGQTTGLENLLREWGLFSPNKQIIELDGNHLVAGDKLPMISPAENPKLHHAIIDTLGLTGQYVELGWLRPVEKDPQATEDAQAQVHDLLRTTGLAREIDIKAAAITTADPKGPFTVAAISERQASDTVDLPSGKLLIYGSTDFITNNMLLTRGANLLLTLNSVNYLASHETILNIRSQTSYEPSLGLTTAQFEGLGWRLALLPAAMALLGLGVCWIRYRS